MGGIGNNAAFIGRMKTENIPGRFFFGMEKAAVFDPLTKGQAGQNQKRLCLLFPDMSGNQCRLMPNKSKLRRYLITKHKNLR